MESFAVTAQFGHVGRGRFIIKEVPIFAENGKDAAYKVRWMARVKHHRKDAILAVKKITGEEYLTLKETHNSDPYFQVHSKQEQALLCKGIEDEIISYDKQDNKKLLKAERKNKIKFKMKKNKIITKDALYSMHNYDA